MEIRTGRFDGIGSVIAGASDEAGGTGVVVATAVGRTGAGVAAVVGAYVSDTGTGAGRGVTGAEDGPEADTGWPTLRTRKKVCQQNRTYHLKY